MQKITKKLTELNFGGWQGILLLILISAITYLPHIIRLTFYRDDWYYIIDGLTGGADIFHAMFSIDRPLRGFLFEGLFSLFGAQRLPYLLSSFLWRTLSGLAAMWLFRLIWPDQKKAAFWCGLLFALYPGYLWWVSGVEYQPMILSVLFQILSIALTILFLKTDHLVKNIFAGFGAVLTGWLYIFFVDYAAGMEVFRYLCIFIVILNQFHHLSIRKKIVLSIRKSWYFLAIPLFYILFNLFLFQNQRPETDLTAHLGGFISDPFYVGMGWLVNLIESTFNTAFFSWFIPFADNFFALRLKLLLSGLLTGLAAVIVILIFSLIRKQQYEPVLYQKDIQNQHNNWQIQAFWIGLIGTIFGALPVVIANRVIQFNAFSHYALPASLAAAFFIVGLIHLIKPKYFRSAILIFITLLAVLTHFSIGTNAYQEEQAVENLWWQMSWRTSSLAPGTTILIDFAEFDQGEDREMVWVPANLIFDPQTSDEKPISYTYSSVPINFETTSNVISGKGETWTYRTHSMDLNYNKFLVISQPSPSACIHVMDNRWPRFSIQDSDQILLLAQYSNIDTLLFKGNAPELSETFFGQEPPHQWCYYYQKAELALQKQDWTEIIRLAEEAESLGYHPIDRIEWMPFLQAAAVLEDAERLHGYATILNEYKFLKLNACQTLQAMPENGILLKPEMELQIQNLFCE